MSGDRKGEDSHGFGDHHAYDSSDDQLPPEDLGEEFRSDDYEGEGGGPDDDEGDGNGPEDHEGEEYGAEDEDYMGFGERIVDAYNNLDDLRKKLDEQLLDDYRGLPNYQSFEVNEHLH